MLFYFLTTKSLSISKRSLLSTDMLLLYKVQKKISCKLIDLLRNITNTTIKIYTILKYYFRKETPTVRNELTTTSTVSSPRPRKVCVVVSETLPCASFYGHHGPSAPRRGRTSTYVRCLWMGPTTVYSSYCTLGKLPLSPGR